MIRFTPPVTVVYFFLVFLFSSCAEKPPEDEDQAPADRPNIVLIVSDDHGSRDLGCYGNPAVKTPNLDGLAEEGVRFTQAYCTSASCSASRSVILTGLYNHANAHYGHQHSYHHFSAYDHVYSLPVLLEELGGYHTGRIGKYHVAPEEVFRFQEVMEASSRNPVAMADSTREFIMNNRNRPFFLYFCTSDPHRSRPTDDDPMAPDRFGNKDGGHEGVEETTFSPEEVIVPPYLPDSPQSREELAEYYQSVARVDYGLGRLFNHLKDAGVWDNTVIFYISDNGIAFAGAKTTVYQPGINLPCLVKNVGGRGAGTVTDAMVNWADLTPTILDLAGVLPLAGERLEERFQDQRNSTVSRSFHGRSFKPVLETGESAGWDTTYASHTFHEITMYYPMKSVITRRYKLIWNIAWQLPYPHASDLWASSTWQAELQDGNGVYAVRSIEDYTHRPEFELYDLEKDPYESTNLAGDPAFSRELEALKDKIRQFQERTSDPWVLKWEHQ